MEMQSIGSPALWVGFIAFVFAIDSVPAIFAITTDPFIVFTSNIFAILGLRSLFFLLAGMVEKFAYLKVGLAAVLVFVGAKMAAVDVVKVPPFVSLGIIALLLGSAILASLLKARRDEARTRRSTARPEIEQPAPQKR